MLDLKENYYSKVYEELISQFKELVETHLALLFEHQHLEDVVGERTAELKKANEQLRQKITEHKQTEEALRFSEANLKKAQEVAKIGSWHLDVIKDQLVWSDETYRMLGVPRDQLALTYKKFLETVHPDDRESVDKAWMAALRNEPYDIEHRIVVGGEVKWVRERAEVEFNEEVQAISGIGTVQDITDRKLAQEQLQKAFSEIKQLKERLEQENICLRDEIEVSYKHEEIIGKIDAVKSVLSQVELVADTDSTVLLLGETGPGKELLARAIHKLSSRKQRPLIKVNCAALPSTLVESELFGREKGAYTGALTKQVGRFEVANGSTIFLDEISEMSLKNRCNACHHHYSGQSKERDSTKR